MGRPAPHPIRGRPLERTGHPATRTRTRRPPPRPTAIRPVVRHGRRAPGRPVIETVRAPRTGARTPTGRPRMPRRHRAVGTACRGGPGIHPGRPGPPARARSDGPPPNTRVTHRRPTAGGCAATEHRSLPFHRSFFWPRTCPRTVRAAERPRSPLCMSRRTLGRGPRWLRRDGRRICRCGDGLRGPGPVGEVVAEGVESGQAGVEGGEGGAAVFADAAFDGGELAFDVLPTLLGGGVRCVVGRCHGGGGRCGR